MDFYDFGYEFASAMAAFAIIMIVFAIIVVGLSLTLWILRSIGLMTIARNRGMQHPWLAWIPVVGVYTLGAIADDINGREGRRTIFRWLLLGGNLLAMVISGMIGGLSAFSAMESLQYSMYDPETFLSQYLAVSGASWIAWLVSLAIYVISVICLYYLYKCYKPQSTTAYTVLSVIFSFMQSIFPFVIRNNQPNWIHPPYPGPGGPGWQQPPMPGGYPPQPPYHDGNPYYGGQQQNPPGQDDYRPPMQ